MSEKTIATGKKLPEFSAPSTHGVFSLSDYEGKILVVYFYPRDNTPGCTQQAIHFRDHIEEFEKLGVTVVGVSRDNMKSHQSFAKKFDLPFTLISDTEESVCNMFDVLKTKKNYGRIYQGIERSTFLFDKSGTLVREWRKVKVDGHIEEVLEAIREMGT